jgi:hypothetical protein
MSDEVSEKSGGEAAPADGKARVMLPRALRPKEEGAGAAAALAAEGKARRQRPFPWVFMILVAVMLGGGWFLVQAMSDDAKLQDCGMSGRKNCVPVDPKLGR